MEIIYPNGINCIADKRSNVKCSFVKHTPGKREVWDSGLRITAGEARLSLARCQIEWYDECRHFLLGWLAGSAPQFYKVPTFLSS
jgi:hypothetical protein